MRLLCLVIALLFPQFLWAQFQAFKPGYYILTQEPGVRHNGELKLRNSNTLLLKNLPGTPHVKMTPDEVSTFSIEGRKYITAKGFLYKMGREYADKAFVRQVDSGAVVLLLYSYPVTNPGPMGPNGMGAPSNSTASEYLIRRAQDSVLTALTPTGLNGGAYFRNMLRPFLATRPDLVKLVDEKRVMPENLDKVIRAFNLNQPCPPSSLRLFSEYY